jgi:hypothetical protein
VTPKPAPSWPACAKCSRSPNANSAPAASCSRTALRTTDFREILDWEGIDGVMIEHFGGFKTDSPNDIKTDLDSVALAAAKGKFVVLKGWPGFNVARKGDDAAPLRRAAQTRPRAPHLSARLFPRRRATRLLLLLLVGLHGSDHGMLDAYPEFDRPLGPPAADATWQGLTATREFAHASVSDRSQHQTSPHRLALTLAHAQRRLRYHRRSGLRLRQRYRASPPAAAGP